MRNLFVLFALLSFMMCSAQTFSSKTEIDFFGNEVTTYYDEWGFEQGTKIESVDLFGNVNTSYQDEFGFEVGTSTGTYDYTGQYEVEYDFNDYGLPQLELSLPSLDLELIKFNNN